MELSLSQWDFHLAHLRVQHKGYLHTAHTMHQHSEAEACRSQLLPGHLLVSRTNREQRPTRTSQQKAAIFLCKQNTPPLAVKIFPLRNGFVLYKHHASGQLFIQCPRAEQKGSPRGAQQS